MGVGEDRVRISNGVALSYAAQGDERGPVVVFLPGPTDSWASYAAVFEHLPASIRSIAVSPRGHGDSDKPMSGYRVTDFAADVVAFLDALGIERAVLAGHSGSCLVARRVAIDHPERVAGLVLEAAPTSLRGHEGLAKFIESVVADLRDPIDPEFGRTFVTDTSTSKMSAEFVEQLVSEVMKVPARVWTELFGDLRVYDDTRELAAIAAPTLLVWGDADEIVDRKMQDTLVSSMAKAELVTYPGVGHTPRWEDPERFARDVANFVSGI